MDEGRVNLLFESQFFSVYVTLFSRPEFMRDSVVLLCDVLAAFDVRPLLSVLDSGIFEKFGGWQFSSSTSSF
jgi:hypothetical protein